jgi:hypothetical protein
VEAVGGHGGGWSSGATIGGSRGQKGGAVGRAPGSPIREGAKADSASRGRRRHVGGHGAWVAAAWAGAGGIGFLIYNVCILALVS